MIKGHNAKRLGVMLLILSLVVLLIPTFHRDSAFFVQYIDVGQGDSILIGMDGHYALIDGGGSTMSVTDTGQYVVVPYLKSLGISRLDYCFNTHPDADHIGGLFAVLDQIEVDEVVSHRDYGENHLQKQFLALAENRETQVHFAEAGEVFPLGDQVTITVLAPAMNAAFTEETLNNGSLALLVSYKDFDVLLTGDVQGEEQMALLDTINAAGDVEVLHIPHHGSKNSYQETWYDAFSPEAVMISVGKENSYGHPYPKITAYWQGRGVKVYRTDMDGSVRITSDGTTGNYETFRK